MVVFRPESRPPGQTPLVVGLQGMAAPLEWNGFLVPTLLDMGLACVLFDTPLAGERSLLRRRDGDVLAELAALRGRRIPLRPALVCRLLDLVARDFTAVLDLLAAREGLTDPRKALFGVSLGGLLSAYAFLRDGVGRRLLVAIAHADLPCFARSYAPRWTSLLASWPVRLLGTLAGARIRAGLDFLAVLRALARPDRRLAPADPMHYLDRVGPDRRVRFLVGEEDPLVRPADAQACARRFPDGECYVVPGLGHGGDGFVDHVRYFLRTQLGDWAG